MLQSQLAAQAVADLNPLDMYMESASEPSHAFLNGAAPVRPSPLLQRRPGRPRLEEYEKKARKSYVSSLSSLDFV